VSGQIASTGSWQFAGAGPVQSDNAPQLFRLENRADGEALQALRAEGTRHLHWHDQLKSQVAELLKSRRPDLRLGPAALQTAAEQLIEARGGDAFGCWVLYPWRQMVVRLLPEPEFAELRTSRNRYKITAEEQERLGRATIGIVGLSAGNAIALCLALERIGGTFRLADHDAIELSNMNRVSCGVTALGLNKAVLTARQLYEIDPYLRIELFDRGVQADDIPSFMDGPPKLDLLIEECDDLYMKVRLREEARARQVAVVMETNDRGLLDVERFDLEPERPILHGLLAGARSEELQGLTTEAKTPFVLRVLGSDMSPRLAASLIEIDKTISGWPQLASGNMLGGAVVTATVRRMLLGEWRLSGRFRIDLEELVEGATTAVPAPLESASPIPLAAEAPPFPLNPKPSVLPSRQEVAWLVGRAGMAPSGGNDQPWRFVWHGGRSLHCYLDRRHAGSFLDYGCSASYLALGAAAENAVIAATKLARRQGLEAFPEPSSADLVFTLTLAEPIPSLEPDPLEPFIEARATNRHVGERRSLDVAQLHALQAAGQERGVELELVSHPDALSEIGAVLGAVDRFRFMCERLHTAMMSELRWSPGEALASRDGIDVATLELDAVGMAGLKIIANERTARFLRSLGKGARLENSARKAIDAASAVGLITIHGTEPRAFFQAGRAMQRIWLTATRLGLAFQPMSVAPYLFLRLTRGGGEGFTPAEVATLSKLRQRFAAIFAPRVGWSEPLLFRLTHAGPPSTRALRRPLTDILTEE
jgi:molybdopterin/thiamine biosynthesis adenylyltransferase/nitroreductase